MQNNQTKKTPPNVKRTLYYYWQEIKQYKFIFWLLILLLPLRILIGNILQPYIFAAIVEKIGQITPETQIWATFGYWIIFFILSEFISGYILLRFQFYQIWKLESNIQKTLREKTFERLNQHSMTFHNDRFAGSMVSAVTKYVGGFERLFDETLWMILPTILLIVGTISVLFWIAPIFAALLLGLIIVYTLIAFYTFRSTLIPNEEVAEAENKLGGQLADTISNIQTVKSYGQEQHERYRFANQTSSVLQTMLSLLKIIDRRNAWFRIIETIAMAAFILFLVYGTQRFGLGVADAILMFTYTSSILMYTWQIPNIFRQVNKAFGESAEMVSILDEQISVTDKEGAQAIAIKHGRIDFDNISFKHAQAKDKIFHNFKLSIKPGERIGLVGKSGSGKTTLTKLLLRFADVQAGSIKIDEQDLREVSQNSLRQNISYVPQESVLFHRSLRENIAYGKLDASDEEIIYAAQMANIWDFIQTLPEGLDTLTGERGVKLSGGQRQRIAIARAILKNAPILVLDEATASLDSESEKLIQGAMQNLMKNKTCIIIAHRLSTVAELDRIIVLKDGQIVEEGSHKDLLVTDNGEYQHLWNIQSGIHN